MLISIFGFAPPVSVQAENLENGTYHALIIPIKWDTGTRQSMYCMDIFDRVMISSNNGKTNLLVCINGYSKYDAIYMVKQDKNDVIDVLCGSSLVGSITPTNNKIGTNWTSFDNQELPGYNEIDNLKDEKLNDCFIKLDKPAAINIDATADRAIFVLEDIDLDKKIGLIGYTGTFMSENNNIAPSQYINNVCFKVHRSDIADERLLSLAYGEDEGDLEIYPILASYYSEFKAYGYETAKGENWRMDFNGTIKNISYDLDDESLTPMTVKLTLDESYKNGKYEIKKVVKRKADSTVLKNQDNYFAYMAGTLGLEWSDNLYDKNTGIATIPLSSKEAIFGATVSLGEKGKPVELGQLFFVDKKVDEPIEIINSDTGISYKSYFPNVHENSNMVVEAVSSGVLHDDFKKKAIDNKFKIVKGYIEEKGLKFEPLRAGKIFVPIPDDWNTDKFYAAVMGNGLYIMWSDIPEENTYMKITEKDGKKYLEINDHFSRTILNGETEIAIAEVNQKIDVSELDPGVYKVEPDFIKYGTESQGSMAGGTLQKEGYLVIGADGSKEVYLNFKSITMEGMEAHMATLWNKTDADVAHFDYVVGADGALLSNAEFNPNTEFACLKAAKVKLWDDTYDSEEYKYHFKVIPPAMGAGQPFEDIYNDPIDADLVFYKAEKLDGFDINTIPTFQKSVLRRSVDKAESLKESDYTAVSYAKLKSALAAGKSYYQGLGGNDAGADKAISNEIKEKSEAIETAIKELEKINGGELTRSEERRVGKECRSRWSPYH